MTSDTFVMHHLHMHLHSVCTLGLQSYFVSIVSYKFIPAIKSLHTLLNIHSSPERRLIRTPRSCMPGQTTISNCTPPEWSSLNRLSLCSYTKSRCRVSRVFLISRSNADIVFFESKFTGKETQDDVGMCARPLWRLRASNCSIDSSPELRGELSTP